MTLPERSPLLPGKSNLTVPVACVLIDNAAARQVPGLLKTIKGQIATITADAGGVWTGSVLQGTVAKGGGSHESQR
jgi:hypothetical protein